MHPSLLSQTGTPEGWCSYKPVGEMLVPSMTSQKANSRAFLVFKKQFLKEEARTEAKVQLSCLGSLLTSQRCCMIISNDFGYNSTLGRITASLM